MAYRYAPLGYDAPLVTTCTNSKPYLVATWLNWQLKKPDWSTLNVTDRRFIQLLSNCFVSFLFSRGISEKINLVCYGAFQLYVVVKNIFCEESVPSDVCLNRKRHRVWLHVKPSLRLLSSFLSVNSSTFHAAACC